MSYLGDRPMTSLCTAWVGSLTCPPLNPPRILARCARPAHKTKKQQNQPTALELRPALRKHKAGRPPAPAGIRQAYRLHGGTPAHLSWSRWAIRGLTYMVTDKGPQAQWLKTIGKVEDASYVCDGWTPQNAAHLYECPWVGDGRGRTREMIPSFTGKCIITGKCISPHAIPISAMSACMRGKYQWDCHQRSEH